MLTVKFDHALTYAHEAHRNHLRKGTGIPYFAHLMAVTAIALEHGADEDTAIAALLHDAVEDCGGAERLADIRSKFGERVANLVSGCSDTDIQPKPPWKERKEKYIAEIASHGQDVQLVSASDKLHNARAILNDYRELGDELWTRFKGGRDGTIWYYRKLTDHFLENGHRRLAEELDRTVRELEELAARADEGADRG